MENSDLRISKALLELASGSDAVLHSTPKARAALNTTKLENAERSLLERIDGFRSMEQVLAMSGDLIGVYGALGKLFATGYVTSTTQRGVVAATPAVANPGAIAAGVNAPAAPEPSELETAKRLLLLEAKLVLGTRAAKLRPRIEACRTIEEIYDLIVKVLQHLTTTGKANPDVFLERLTNNLAAARKKSSAAKRASLQ